MIYENGDEFKGKLDNNGLRERKNNIKEGKGIYSLNNNDYIIFKENLEELTINQLFNLNFKEKIFYGEIKNDIKEGEGILIMKKNYGFWNKIIYVNNFKDKKNREGYI